MGRFGVGSGHSLKPPEFCGGGVLPRRWRLWSSLAGDPKAQLRISCLTCIRTHLRVKAVGDPREVVSDPEARYFGGLVEERSLVPLGEARLGRIGLDEWLRRSPARA